MFPHIRRGDVSCVAIPRFENVLFIPGDVKGLSIVNIQVELYILNAKKEDLIQILK